MVNCKIFTYLQKKEQDGAVLSNPNLFGIDDPFIEKPVG